MATYTKDQLKQLVNGTVDKYTLHDMQSQFKDPDRFHKILEVWQEHVDWDDRIILPLAENLFVVLKEDGKRIIKSRSGYEFCEVHENWKLHARVFLRNTEEQFDELYPRKMACHPDWMEIREYYDPNDGTLLEVEAVPPGYPAIHDFQPDIDTVYNEWLGQPLQ